MRESACVWASPVLLSAAMGRVFVRPSMDPITARQFSTITVVHSAHRPFA